MRLNRQDGGHRQSIMITNNEVGADEQQELLSAGYRSGDSQWEQWGICSYITQPRIAAAINGTTPNGEAIKGTYKTPGESSMSDGFEENAEFFSITYESPCGLQVTGSSRRLLRFCGLGPGLADDE